MNYENRLPVENTTDFSFFRKNDTILPNHPYELASIPFNKHQALEAGFSISWQPGQKYIEFPWGKAPLGYLTQLLTWNTAKALIKLLEVMLILIKWKFTVFDDVNLKLRGLFNIV